ncbi:hypothetical protein BC567DRAFT_237047 [Phyllosticta citribraziliensis]
MLPGDKFGAQPPSGNVGIVAGGGEMGGYGVPRDEQYEAFAGEAKRGDCPPLSFVFAAMVLWCFVLWALIPFSLASFCWYEGGVFLLFFPGVGVGRLFVVDFLSSRSPVAGIFLESQC